MSTPLKEQIAKKVEKPTPLSKIYEMFPEKANTTIRARIYENLGELFEKLERGVYVGKIKDSEVAVVKGDAWEELSKLEDNSFDMILADPPYPWLDHHVKTGTTRKKDNELSFETKEPDKELLEEFRRVLKRGGHCFIFVPSLNKDTLEPEIDLIQTAQDSGFNFNKYFVWNKECIGMGYNGRAKYEGVLFLSKGKRRMPIDKSIPDLISEKRIYHGHKDHETEKPVGLLEKLVKFSTKEGETVLDPFAGSGSTGEACINLSRNCVLIEREQKFIDDMIIPRLSKKQ